MTQPFYFFRRPTLFPSLPACGLLAVWATFSPAAAQPPVVSSASSDSSRAAIAAAYDQISAAYHRRDLGRVMSYFTPDYVEVDSKGAKRDRDQLLRQYQDWLRKIHTMQTRYVIGGVTVIDGGDLVDMRMHSDGTGEKKVLFARLRGTFTNDMVVRDLWVETPSGWRLKHRLTLLDETHIHPG